MISGTPMTSQVRSNTKCLTFPFDAFPPQNVDNIRISSLWIDMIRICDISKHRPKPEVTFSEIKVIWGHKVKLPISAMWRRDTCLWVGFSSERDKRPSNIVCCIEIKIQWVYGTAWFCVQMPWKVAILHIQNALKTTFMKGITWNLVPTYILLLIK